MSESLESRFRRAMDALTNVAFVFEDEELIRLCDELDPIQERGQPPSINAVDPVGRIVASGERAAENPNPSLPSPPQEPSK